MLYSFNDLFRIFTIDSNGNAAGSVTIAESSDITKIDNNSDGNQYIGTAPQGSATSASVWAITRNDNGAPKTFLHSQPLQVWDDRATTVTYT